MIWKVKNVFPSPSLLLETVAADAAPWPWCACPPRSSMRMGCTSCTTPGRSSRRYFGGLVESSARREDTSAAMAAAELVGEEAAESDTTGGELDGEKGVACEGPLDCAPAPEDDEAGANDGDPAAEPATDPAADEPAVVEPPDPPAAPLPLPLPTLASSPSPFSLSHSTYSGSTLPKGSASSAAWFVTSRPSGALYTMSLRPTSARYLFWNLPGFRAERGPCQNWTGCAWEHTWDWRERAWRCASFERSLATHRESKRYCG